MGPIHYYLVNHTKLEFCFFNHRVPVFEELKRILDKYPTWKSTDAIMVEGEDVAQAPDLWENLSMNLQYKELESDEDLECDEQADN